MYIKDYVTDKNLAIETSIKYMLNRTLAMFKYDNLPDEISGEIIEKYLQTKGNLIFTKIDNNFVILTGEYGSDTDIYGNAKKYIVNNTNVRLFREFTIDKDCVVIKNDTMEIGLLPILMKYCSLICETDISIRSAVINSRMISLLTANDEKTKRSAEIYLQKILNGENAIIASNPFFEGLKTQNIPNTQNLLQSLITLHEYLKATMYNELGLNANYLNMKRENITITEAQLSDDFLLPLIDNMKLNRVRAIDKINTIYGLSIEVELGSTWKTNELENEKQKQIYESKLSV